MSDQIQLIDKARAALEMAKSIDEVVELRDQAQAMAAYLRKREGAAEAARHAAELRLRAERKIGGLLPEKARGVSCDAVSQLAESGAVARKRAERFRKVAEPAAEHFEDYLDDCHGRDETPTTAGFLRYAASVARRERAEDLRQDKVEESTSERAIRNLQALADRIAAGDEEPYDIILADPPWAYREFSEAKHGAASACYQTMDEVAIGDLPVGELAAPNCALLMWGTWPKLVEGLEVMQSWGFRYVTCPFVWNKTYRDGSPYCGLGFYTRSGTEFCLLGLKGRMPRGAADVRQVFNAPVKRHSQKPVAIYKLISRLWPGSRRRIELFARNTTPGWDSWGNQIESTLFNCSEVAP